VTGAKQHLLAEKKDRWDRDVDQTVIGFSGDMFFVYLPCDGGIPNHEFPCNWHLEFDRKNRW
jgi:hypothetical protein